MQTVESREEFLRQIPQGVDAVEVGVLRGEFSEMILGIVRPATLVLIDPFCVNEEKYADGLSTAYSTDADYRAVCHKLCGRAGVMIDRRFSHDAVSGYPDGRFGLIYIDACHLYESVKRDLNDWKAKLASSGVLCGHDYIDFADFGVKRAVDEFCAENGFEMFLLNESGGDFALKAA